MRTVRKRKCIKIICRNSKKYKDRGDYGLKWTKTYYLKGFKTKVILIYKGKGKCVCV